MERINVEEIVEQIRNDIKERGIKDSEVLFESIAILNGGTGCMYNDEAYEEVLNEVNSCSMVQSYRDLLGNPIERFIKKVIRRLVAFYIESIVDDQNRFNKNVYSALVMNRMKTKEDDEQIEILEKKLYEYEKRIIALEKKLEEKER